MDLTREEQRLQEAHARVAHWRRWGPYLSERQWGTVREDYSPDGAAWDHFPHDQARWRAYRWGEDGIAGISDNHQRLCFAIALWNGADPILKERLFGLTGGRTDRGNHGEDVKEYCFYLDNTPTHSYMKCLYKYPHRAFPYELLVRTNGQRDRSRPEYELLDTGIFDEERYFDVFVTYAKHSAEDILIQIDAINRGPESAELEVLPMLWCRNTWSWGTNGVKPKLAGVASTEKFSTVEALSPDAKLGTRWLYCEAALELLFTENETNFSRFGGSNASPYAKDAFHEYIVAGRTDAVNLALAGTKAAARYKLRLEPGEAKTIRLRLSDTPELPQPFGLEFEATLEERRAEADEFYKKINPFPMEGQMREVQRRAFAGLLWNKQYYHYVVEDWLKGDSNSSLQAANRGSRNKAWSHLFNDDILSMPDKWEYPWFAAWDTAFHTIPLALIDPDFAKRQLDLLTREWYMHPNGQLPAYEWAFSDVNPPVHAWAVWRVYKIEKKMHGRADRQFLERLFDKLLVNFTWWVNRKDNDGNNVFQGGFLGLDNISVFDRSQKLPTGGCLDQADGTSWMGMYCLNMLRIALELAKTNPIYEDMANKFFQHFLYIARSLNRLGDDEADMWDKEDELFYDLLQLPDHKTFNGKRHLPLKVRSLVGLIPLFAVETIDLQLLDSDPLSDFKERFEWFVNNRPDLVRDISNPSEPGLKNRRLLSLVGPERLRSILTKVLDESEFLSPYGIRSVSKFHLNNPYVFPFELEDDEGRFFKPRVGYEPAESQDGLFGGNSNWRGPVWFPINFLLIESLQKFHRYLGDDFKVECPTGSGKLLSLWEVSLELSGRLVKLFLKTDGRRPIYGGTGKFQSAEHWRELILFYEYFHGDNGAGLGASSQTGWTGLVAKLIQQWGEYEGQDRQPDI